MKEVTDRIKSLTTERDRLLEVLELWNSVYRAGIKYEDVQAFSFRTQFLTKSQITMNRSRYRDGQRHDIWTSETYHNCVRLKTGEILPIPMTKKPS